MVVVPLAACGGVVGGGVVVGWWCGGGVVLVVWWPIRDGLARPYQGCRAHLHVSTIISGIGMLRQSNLPDNADATQSDL